jgi:Protein of unknown function (DUF3027)
VNSATRTGTKPTARTAAPDAACAAAVDLARAAAQEMAGPGQVGEHLGAEAEGDRLVAHSFASMVPGYRGWRWVVTLARAPRSKTITVNESVLLPGEDALRPPPCVPWLERLRPGDLGVGDVLPAAPDDDRLEPGWAQVEVGESASGDGQDTEAEDAAVAWELGLGRARVLSPIGRADAVDRWYSGEPGPEALIALAAPAPCSTCGFLLPLAGVLRRMFGICANEYSPSDGRVVSVDHGCGAHSEAVVTGALLELTDVIVDDLYDLDDLDIRGTSGGTDVGAASSGDGAGSVDDAEPAEELGHS